MKRLFNIVKITLVSLIAVLYSCGDKDEYNWDDVEPGKQIISRASADSSKIKLDSIKGDNITIKEYVAFPRGGSQYNWVTSNNFLILLRNEEEPYKIKVKADSKIDTSAWLWVQEITRSNKKSEPDSFKILITGYCAYDINQLLGSGNFSSKMSLYAEYPVTLTRIAGDTIVNSNFFNMNWSVKYVLSKDNEEKVTIVPHQEFLYNGEKVEIRGSGTYNTCKSRFEVKYAVVTLHNDTVEYGWGTDVLQLKQ